jgi:hypothetical protein
MANIVTNPTANQTIQAYDLLPAASNPAITGQSFGESGAPWQASYINLQMGNAVVYADQCPGSDAFAQINYAQTLLPGGTPGSVCGSGTVDARGFGAGLQNVSTQLIVGATGNPVNLIVDANTNFTINIKNSTVDAIEVWIDSSIVALGATNSANNSGTFVLASTAIVKSVIATYPQNASETRCYLQGFTLKGNSGATVSDSLLRLVNVTDMSTFRNLCVWNFYGTGVHIQSVSGQALGPFNFDNCTVDGSGNAGAQPVLVDVGTTTDGIIVGVNFIGGSYTHPETRR